MFCGLALVSVLALANGAALDKRGLQVLDTGSLHSFSDMFKQALLDKVLVVMNHNKAMTTELNTKMAACSAKLKTQTDACNSCAKSTCHATLMGTLTGAAVEVTHQIEHIGSSIGHAIGSIFGKKRAIDAATRACMEKCASCRPLLITDHEQMVSAVCGAGLISLNNTVHATLSKSTAVYNAAIDTTHPILTKLEYDPASLNSDLQMTTTYVTVMLNGAHHRYKTSVPYATMNLPETARQMALEYWSKSH